MTQTTNRVLATEGKATTIRTTFSRETSITISIHAETGVIWDLLTRAENYPAWNSTVTSIKGNIAPGGQIGLVSTLDPKRVFKLRVKEFEPHNRLVWGDGQGNRIFTLEAKDSRTVLFSMTEKIGGLMFPLYAGWIPPFDDAFEKFARDLKKAAEAGINKIK